MIPREQVVRDIVAGIGRRADMIVVPLPNPIAIAARAPGFLRRFIERAAFRSGGVERAARHCRARQPVDPNAGSSAS
ncbi:hypothetical protein [Burkholderia sp. BE17]|uniref:hypothetical protein n=1 Tax=Burkholderia sp. BE17 TaxID=2656644 RepID=UPI001D116972|nr:hypothetical protein [Burkholderia sp. BE17]